jgi:hypothetical protein
MPQEWDWYQGMFPLLRTGADNLSSQQGAFGIGAAVTL